MTFLRGVVDRGFCVVVDLDPVEPLEVLRPVFPWDLDLVCWSSLEGIRLAAAATTGTREVVVGRPRVSMGLVDEDSGMVSSLCPLHRRSKLPALVEAGEADDAAPVWFCSSSTSISLGSNLSM